jgi:hypothetical protein
VHVFVGVTGLAACGRIAFDSSVVGQDSDAAALDAAPADGPPADAAPCGFTCVADAINSTCGAGPITYALISPGDPYVLRVDLTGFTSLEIGFEACNTTGTWFQVADSPTSTTAPGDQGTFSNNAHAVMTDTSLVVYANDYESNIAVINVPGFSSAVGCVLRTVTFEDQRVNVEGYTDYARSTLLRLSPPADALGAPNRIWYLGIDRVVSTSSSITGAGLLHATLCLR